MYELIFNLNQWFRRRSGDAVLKYFLSRDLVAVLFGGAEPFRFFGNVPYKEEKIEIVLKLGLWLRRDVV